MDSLRKAAVDSGILRVIVLLVVGTVLGSAAAGAKPRPLQVDVGEPNLWTLEQAHYLLARMHATNDRLKTQFPSPQNLDPNAIHGSRLDLLRTVVSASVAFDQTVGAKNDVELTKAREDLARRDALRSRLDQKRDDLLAVVRDLTTLKTERARLAAEGAGEDQTDVLDAQIAGLEAQKAVLEQEITSLGPELQALTIASPAFGTASAPAGEGAALPQEVLGNLVQSALNAPPRSLHASRVLDNYIQMQYEIIAKQLTLLKDETAPGHRLVFLELPQSVDSVPGRAKPYLARVHWRVAALGQVPCEEPDREAKASRYEEQQRPKEPSEILAACRWEPVSERSGASGLPRGDRLAVVDLIPRQSALNVAAIHGKTKGLSLGAKLAWLAGFAGGASFERRREMLDQFIQEDVFASAFGKGADTFGWTFGRRPGEKAVAPGIRTTYAVLVVPERARALRLEGEGCAYSRKTLPPSPFAAPASHGAWCGQKRTFELLIPSERTNGWYLEEVRYSAVESGERITVFLAGSHFSPQTGVLVNGTSLRRVPSIARELAVVGTAPAPAVDGVFEIVNSENMVLAFSMGPGYVGTPLITLVSPAKVLPINHFPDLRINERRRESSLAAYSEAHPMFRERLAIGDVRMMNRGSGSLEALLTGSGFRNGIRVLINGKPACPSKGCSVVSSGELRLSLNPPAEGLWDVTVQLDSTQRIFEAHKRLEHPLAPRILGYEILRYEPPRDGKPAEMDLVLTGENLEPAPDVVPAPSSVKVGPPQVLSSRQILLSLLGVEEPTVLHLVRPGANVGTVVSVFRPEPPTVTRLANGSAGGKPEGLIAGGYPVEIHGANMAGVSRVFFDGAPAKNVRASGSVIHVTVPAHAAGAVRVLLESDVTYRGSRLTNVRDFEDPKGAVFTYVKPPEAAAEPAKPK